MPSTCKLLSSKFPRKVPNRTIDLTVNEQILDRQINQQILEKMLASKSKGTLGAKFPIQLNKNERKREGK